MTKPIFHDARNFNETMAAASSMTVAEVEEIVPAGTLGADGIHVPGIFVKKLVLGSPYQKHIEFKTTRAREHLPPAASVLVSPSKFSDRPTLCDLSNNAGMNAVVLVDPGEKSI
jgi:acyl CoA:acetate/3-ketoacid CoA transferase